MSLEVTQLEIGPFSENCYVVRLEEGEEAVVVDPGWPGVLSAVEQVLGDARCAAILITHGDIDHVGGVAEVARATGAPVYMSADESDRLERIGDFVPAGLEGLPFEPYEPDVRLRGDEEIDVAGISFQTLSVPGHTRAHLAFAAEDAVFSGDVLFAGGVGRTDRPDGDWETLLASIRTLADRLSPEIVVYPGHGQPTTIGRELESNPFLAELRAANP
jgi:glyoxylase-like metal-dependent hydrolase (beta-lactamase superfamily II)